MNGARETATSSPWTSLKSVMRQSKHLAERNNNQVEPKESTKTKIRKESYVIVENASDQTRMLSKVDI